MGQTEPAFPVRLLMWPLTPDPRHTQRWLKMQLLKSAAAEGPCRAFLSVMSTRSSPGVLSTSILHRGLQGPWESLTLFPPRPALKERGPWFQILTLLCRGSKDTLVRHLSKGIRERSLEWLTRLSWEKLDFRGADREANQLHGSCLHWLFDFEECLSYTDSSVLQTRPQCPLERWHRTALCWANLGLRSSCVPTTAATSRRALHYSQLWKEPLWAAFPSATSHLPRGSSS